jgi:hypothetical protein
MGSGDLMKPEFDAAAAAGKVSGYDRQRVAAGPAAPPAPENPVTSIKNAPQAAAAADCHEGADEQTPRTKSAPADSAGASDPALRVDTVAPIEPAPSAPKAVAEAPTQNVDDDLSIPEFLRREEQPGQNRKAA